VPIKTVQGLPDESLRGGLDLKVVVHWLRLHLGGRRKVDLEVLKKNVLNLTERQWRQALGSGPIRQRRQDLAKVSS
jgi:hypothetical protein